MDCARAAVENGANAVYFGLQNSFNARARAVNFTADELPGLLGFLHQRGVKGYLTLNTLVFPDELPLAEQAIRQAAAAGVDAVLVQDLGVARLMQAICPELPLHASTQMTLSCAAAIAMAQDLGLRRVVLPRELSLDEIALLARQTTVELEVFVHGALCISYSGQCLASLSLGGRSANRGQCAQACRMPYELICDGQPQKLDRKYLLSPQDLAAFDLVPRLAAAGVAAFKIEGRMKTAEYVAAVTRHYRRAIDAAVAGQSPNFSAEERQQLELSFSRGLGPGWLEGPNPQRLVSGQTSSNRGVLLGTVVGIRGSRVSVRLQGPVQRGDGLVFEGDRAADAEQGGRVYEVLLQGRSQDEPIAAGVVDLGFQYDALDLRQIYPGQLVWKTDDPRLARQLRRTFSGSTPQRRVPLDLKVTAAVGQPLSVEAVAASGTSCRVQSDEPLQAARKHALTPEVLREQFGRLGGSAYELRNVEAVIDGQPMVPLSVLGRLRHEMLRQLDEAVLRTQSYPTATQPVLHAMRAAIASTEVATTASQLHVLCRTLDQVLQAIDGGATSLIADFREPQQYPEALRMARAAGASLLLAGPRIVAPGEEHVLDTLAGYQADGILARNLATLGRFAWASVPVVADFTLNAANELSVAWLREHGATRVTAALDLDRQRLVGLAAAVPAAWLEVVVYQHVPMFYTEHCLFCGLLSEGTDCSNCGRPCRQYEIQLRDHTGSQHPVAADAACRNTVYNAAAQSAIQSVPALLSAGVRHFRLELLAQHGADEVGRLVGLCRRAVEPDRAGG